MPFTLLVLRVHSQYKLLWQNCIRIFEAVKILRKFVQLRQLINRWSMKLKTGSWLAFVIQFSSVQLLSLVWLFATPKPQHAKPPCPTPTPRVHRNSCPLNWWCHTTISSSVIPFSSGPQSFPTSGSFPMSQLFSSGGQSIGDSASASVLPMNIHDWFLLGRTSLIPLQSKGLSRVFSNTTIQKHQFFGIQLSLWSNSHIHTWLLEKP